MVSASSDKPAIEFDRMAFQDELKRNVLLDINCQADDTPESRTADGYKMYLEHLNKRLKSNGCDAIYTACMIGQCLTELKHIYHGIKKLVICEPKDLFWELVMSTFSLTCVISPQLIIRFHRSHCHYGQFAANSN